MAYDQFGNPVPDGTPGSTPTPPGPPPAGGSYYTGDPNNPLTADPNAGFGVRSLPPGAVNQNTQVRVNTAAYGQGGIPGAAGVASAPPPTNYGTMNPGSSPLAGAFGNAPSYGQGSVYDPVTLANTYGTTHGLDPYSGQNAVNAQRASNLDTIFMLLNGRAAEFTSPGQYADWSNQYLSQGGSQGMSTADFFNAAFTNDQKNPVWGLLHTQKTSSGQTIALSPADQVKAFYQLMDQGLANTVPPNILQSMEAMYGQAGTEYIQAMNSGQYNKSFTDFLQERGLGPQMMGGQ